VFQIIKNNRRWLVHIHCEVAAPSADCENYVPAKYQDFFNPWKDADPDVPILKEAKTEYAKLP
jgi:hypothetical protein